MHNCIHWMNSITDNEIFLYFKQNRKQLLQISKQIFFLWEMKFLFFGIFFSAQIFVRFSILLTKYHTHTLSLSPKEIWKCKSVVYWISIKIKIKNKKFTHKIGKMCYNLRSSRDETSLQAKVLFFLFFLHFLIFSCIIFQRLEWGTYFNTLLKSFVLESIDSALFPILLFLLDPQMV